MVRAKFACVFMLAFCITRLSADTEFEGAIPVAIVEALFDSYADVQFAVYSDIPDDFPDIALPDGFDVVGSVYQMSRLRVVFETALAQTDAMASMTETFELQDWVQFPLFRPPYSEVGFIQSGRIDMSERQILCHDELGQMALSYAARESGNYLSLGWSLLSNRQQGDCAQQIALQQASLAPRSRTMGLRQYLPRMEIPGPQSPQLMAAFVGGGSSSSGNTIETDGTMTTDLGIEEVYRHFADQIQGQDWALDTEAIGARSATGTWTKSPEADLQLFGTLSIVNSGDEDYDLQFRLTAEGFTENSLFFGRPPNR